MKEGDFVWIDNLLGQIVIKEAYYIAIECENGKFIEGDIDELAIWRGLKIA